MRVINCKTTGLVLLIKSAVVKSREMISYNNNKINYFSIYRELKWTLTQAWLPWRHTTLCPSRSLFQLV